MVRPGPRTVLVRFLGGLIPVFLLVFLVSGWAALELAETTLVGLKERQARTFTDLTARFAGFNLSKYSYFAMEQYVQTFQERGPGAEIVSIRVLDRDGRLVSLPSLEQPGGAVPPNHLRTYRAQALVPVEGHPVPVGSVEVILSLEPIYQALGGLQFLFVVILAAAAVVLGMASAHLLNKLVVAPLRTLRDAAQEIAREPKALETGVKSSDEIGDLARSVESMSQDLATLFSRIHAANNDLEVKVGERTTELEGRNAELVSTLEELRTTQRYLVDSEKYTSLGRLVAGVAHEINTPLGIGVTMASYLRERVEDLQEKIESGTLTRADYETATGDLASGFTLLENNLQRTADLVTSFKKLSADQSRPEFHPFRWKDLADDVLLSLGHHFKHEGPRLVSEVDPDLVLVSSPGVWSQILSNLILNARIHAFDPGDRGSVLVLAKQGKKNFIVQVVDDGKGIADEHQSQIFEPFFTTKRGSGGTGLGLSIVHNLVTHALGGTIRCKSRPGKGTRMVIREPIRARADKP